MFAKKVVTVWGTTTYGYDGQVPANFVHTLYVHCILDTCIDLNFLVIISALPQ